MKPTFRNFFLSVSLLYCSLVMTETLLYSQNTLYLNDQWMVEKRMMKMFLMGADDFLISRQPLSKNTLDLGPFFGFQEIISRRPFSPEKIRFHFKIEDHSYLDLTFGRNSGGNSHFHGLRLGGDQGVPSLFFTSTAEGKFLFSQKWKGPALSKGWHRATLKKSGNSLILSVDDDLFKTILPWPLSPGNIGFRAGLQGAQVKDLEIVPLVGSAIKMDFRNTRNWVRIWAFNFILLIALGILLSLISPKRLEVPFLFLIFGVSFWFLFDFYFYSRRYHQGLTRPLFGEREMNLDAFCEGVRSRVFGVWDGLTGGHSITLKGIADRGYPPDRIYLGPIYCGPSREKCRTLEEKDIPPPASRAKEGYRILFLGSSQSVGAGARTLEETFFVRAHQLLKNALSPPLQLESLNTSVSALDSADLLVNYRKTLLSFKPNLMIINLANNDYIHQKKDFRQQMKGFLELNRTQKIKTILLEEGNAPEWKNDGLLKNHQVLRELGKEYQVPVWPLHDFLGQETNLRSGKIWWDFVHLTSYGQELTARWLAPRILQTMRGL